MARLHATACGAGHGIRLPTRECAWHRAKARLALTLRNMSYVSNHWTLLATPTYACEVPRLSRVNGKL